MQKKLTHSLSKGSNSTIIKETQINDYEVLFNNKKTIKNLKKFVTTNAGMAMKTCMTVNTV